MRRGKVQGARAVEETGHRWPSHAPAGGAANDRLQKAGKETKTKGNLSLSF